MDNKNESVKNMKCTPCSRGAEPLRADQLSEYMNPLSEGWQVTEGYHLEKAYKFKDFKQALSFTNHIGEIAEEQGHHPDILLSWGKVVVMLFTHKINGLSENDFILAAKIDQIPQ